MTDYKTPRGTIHYGGTCVDDYPNIEIYDQPPKGGAPVVLQAPAMRSFKAAEKRYGKDRPSGWRAIPLTGSHRTCAQQTALHNSDPARFATADGSGHPRGICIDVSMAQSGVQLAKIHRALTTEGWKQARSDEPWHYSYFLSV